MIRHNTVLRVPLRDASARIEVPHPFTQEDADAICDAIRDLVPRLPAYLMRKPAGPVDLSQDSIAGMDDTLVAP